MAGDEVALGARVPVQGRDRVLAPVLVREDQVGEGRHRRIVREGAVMASFGVGEVEVGRLVRSYID